MKVELLDSTVDPLYVISMCARTCYNSRSKDQINKRADFVKGLIKSGHTSTLENAIATFDISGISRVCQNQIVRHRIGCSYCVQSMRYVDVADNKFVMPIKALMTDDSCVDFVRKAKDFYKKLVQNDVPKEDARMFLPLGMDLQYDGNNELSGVKTFLAVTFESAGTMGSAVCSP